MKKIANKVMSICKKIWAVIEQMMMYIKLVLFGKAETKLVRIPESEVPEDIFEQELKNSIDAMVDRMLGSTN